MGYYLGPCAGVTTSPEPQGEPHVSDEQKARPRSERRELAEPISDSFENVVGAVMNTPAKKNWRYEKASGG